MIPYILAAVGGYLIGGAKEDSKIFKDGGYMAKGGRLKVIPKGEEYKYGQRWTDENSQFMGSFELPNWRNTGYLLKLDEHDKELVKNIELKDGEHIFRYHTYTTKISNQEPLIKINIPKALAYFISEKGKEEGIIEFEKKGHKVDFLNYVEELNGKYMEDGGEVGLVKPNDEYYSDSSRKTFVIDKVEDGSVYISKKGSKSYGNTDIISIDDFKRLVKAGAFIKL